MSATMTTALLRRTAVPLWRRTSLQIQNTTTTALDGWRPCPNHNRAKPNYGRVTRLIPRDGNLPSISPTGFPPSCSSWPLDLVPKPRLKYGPPMKHKRDWIFSPRTRILSRNLDVIMVCHMKSMILHRFKRKIHLMKVTRDIYIYAGVVPFWGKKDWGRFYCA